MITLKIGNEERTDANIKERWIAQQIRKRKEDGTPICVRVVIRHSVVDLILSSAACSGGGSGGGRQPNLKEQRLIELWNKKGLNEKKINPGLLISFLDAWPSVI